MLDNSAITNFLESIPDTLTPIGTIVGIICLVIAGIMMMTGTENASKAKKWIIWICVGLAVMFFAVAIVTSISAAAGVSE